MVLAFTLSGHVVVDRIN